MSARSAGVDAVPAGSKLVCVLPARQRRRRAKPNTKRFFILFSFYTFCYQILGQCSNLRQLKFSSSLSKLYVLTFIKCRAIHIGRHSHHLYHLITHERNVMTLHNCSKMCFRGIDSFQVCSLVFMVSIHSKVCSCVFMVLIHSKVCSCVFMVSIHSKFVHVFSWYRFILSSFMCFHRIDLCTGCKQTMWL